MLLAFFRRYCLKKCVGPDCHTQPKYAIEYKTVALPFGIGANTDLVRLAVYTSDDELHLNTRLFAVLVAQEVAVNYSNLVGASPGFAVTA